MTMPLYTSQPRILTAGESRAITAQCIRVTYPDDMTPRVPVAARWPDDFPGKHARNGGDE